MTAIIYARYSSDNQREESIEGQIRECTINLVFDDRDTVFFRIVRAFPNLAFNGFFTLVVR